MMRMDLQPNRYAILRTLPRIIAGTLRNLAGGMCKFLGLRYPYNYAARHSFRLYIPVRTQRVHPALERSTVKTRLLLDLPVTHRRAAKDPAHAFALMRLPQHQPAIKPHGRAHPFEMARFEEHAPQPGVIVSSAHFPACFRSRERADCFLAPADPSTATLVLLRYLYLLVTSVDSRFAFFARAANSEASTWARITRRSNS